jgi:hypothetical protein
MPEEIRQLKRKSTNYTYWIAHALIAIYKERFAVKAYGHEKFPEQVALLSRPITKPPPTRSLWVRLFPVNWRLWQRKNCLKFRLRVGS